MVDIEFTPSGTEKFAGLTAANIGKAFAIVFENKVLVARWLPSSARRSPGGRSLISGPFNHEPVELYAMLLRSGELPAPLSLVQERLVGPGSAEPLMR